MIVLTAMKWAPPFAAGMVRDHRIRWVLNEVGWDYQVRLVDAPAMASDAYRAKQPFGQVPLLEEEGRPPLFETGAILIDVATRAGKLIPADEDERAKTICWVVAALNSLEPFLMNVAEVEYFIEEEAMKNARRPAVREFAAKRLQEFSEALGKRQYLVGADFTIADLLMASVLRIARRLDLLDPYPNIVTYQNWCLDRPAYVKAVADQMAEISSHNLSDMKYELAKT
jgi:glutathione S-transferase